MENETYISNMIAWAKEALGTPEYTGWVPLSRVLAQKPD